MNFQTARTPNRLWRVSGHGPRVMRFGGAAAAVGLSLGACSPALDWRDVRPSGTALSAQMPCRPSAHARKLVLAGQPREMNLLSCSADDATWGLAWVEGIEPANLGGTLAALRRGSLVNIGSEQASVSPFAIPGATPQPQAGRLRSEGKRADGSLVTQEMVLFAHGTTVFQATLLSTKSRAAAADDFFGALRFAP